jgi:Ser/Thr protein kinase RdoA (MazF antagonist)
MTRHEAHEEEAPYARLSPDSVIAAVEAAGELSDGRVLALGSYENRVYQVGREDADPLVVKFYRPGRWSDAAILEEHQFALELAAAEVPVVAPLQYAGRTLLEHEGFRYALFPRRGGRWPELGHAAEREWMGRFLGRMHRVGQAQRFQHRPLLSIDTFGDEARAAVLDSAFVPDYLEQRYAEVTGALLDAVEAEFSAVQPLAQLRIHGDCHRNNVLWTDAGPHFVDLDDCMTGPAIQDLWMLLAGSRAEMAEQVRDLLEGYEQFADFDRVQVRLIEPLRTLRMIHYSAWLARRWHDPAFPRAFPWFAEPRYWERHVGELQEQFGAMEQGALEL